MEGFLKRTTKTHEIGEAEKDVRATRFLFPDSVSGISSLPDPRLPLRGVSLSPWGREGAGPQ